MAQGKAKDSEPNGLKHFQNLIFSYFHRECNFNLLLLLSSQVLEMCHIFEVAVSYIHK